MQELVNPLWVVFLHLPHCAVLSIFFPVKNCGNKQTVNCYNVSEGLGEVGGGRVKVRQSIGFGGGGRGRVKVCQSIGFGGGGMSQSKRLEGAVIP